jgi:protein SCO1
MKRSALSVSLLLWLWCATANAALPAAALASAGIDLPRDARVPLNLTADDASGRHRRFAELLDGHPGFVIFADYTCKTLCGPALVLLGSALAQSGLPPNLYRLIVIGIDPKDTPQDARRMAAAQIPEPLRDHAILLLPDARALAIITKAVGFRYVYDKSVDQFAHPEIVYTVAEDGRVLRLLSPLALTASDIRTAFSESAEAPQTLYGRFRVLCYRFELLTGVHTAVIERLLKISSVLTIAAMAGGLFVMVKRRGPA